MNKPPPLNGSRINTPLECVRENNQLVIRIGLNQLKFVTEHCPLLDNMTDDGPYCEIVNRWVLAEDIRCELLREKEDGTTPLHVLFDNAIVAAMENGSLAFKDK